MNLAFLFADAFGNAVGNSIVSKLSQPPKTTKSEEAKVAIATDLSKKLEKTNLVNKQAHEVVEIISDKTNRQVKYGKSSEIIKLEAQLTPHLMTTST